MGKPVVMGRKTFETLKKPLDGRTNIVVTRAADFQAAGALVVSSIDDALAIAAKHVPSGKDGEVIIMGGAEIYAQTLPIADRIYYTQIHAHPDGDTTFPDLGAGQWREVSSDPIVQGPRDDHPATLRVYDRNRDHE